MGGGASAALKKENDTLKQRVQELQSELQDAEKRAQAEEKEAASKAAEAEEEKQAEARRDDEESLAKLKQELSEVEATHAECGHARGDLEQRLAKSSQEVNQEQECMRNATAEIEASKRNAAELADELRDMSNKEASEAAKFSEETRKCAEARGVITEEEVAAEGMQSSMLAMKAALEEANKEREVTEQALRLALAQNPTRQQRLQAEEAMEAEGLDFAPTLQAGRAQASAVSGAALGSKGHSGSLRRSPQNGRAAAAQQLLLEIENAYLQTGMLPPPRVQPLT